MTPTTGVEDILSEQDRGILTDALHEAFEEFSELELLAAELSLIGEPSEVETAEELMDSFLDAIGQIEAFYPSSNPYKAVLQCQELRRGLTAASRQTLRIDSIEKPRQMPEERSSVEAPDQTG